MAFATLHQLSLADIRLMASGVLEDTLTDLDFLETLAAHKCVILPPFVYQTFVDGGLVKLTPLIYNIDGKLNKPLVLLNVARALGRWRGHGFGRRFSV